MKMLAGNWKMNTTPQEGLALLDALVNGLTPERIGEVHLVVAPPFTHLWASVQRLWDFPEISVAAQNCHEQASGAYTGEVSLPMLKDLDVDAVLLGHSERRQYFGETDRQIASKLRAALNAEISPILCVGETLEERKSGREWEVVQHQLQVALADVSADEAHNVVVAYEPVWAIGTGEVASPEQAQEMHARIRTWLRERFDADTASIMALLYGGSVKPDNAAALFGQKDINGGLIGGSSLKSDDFLALLDALRSA